MASSDDNDVPPVYLKNADLPGVQDGAEYSEFTMCMSVAAYLGGDDQLVGCQRVGEAWQIYPWTHTGRRILLTENLEIGGQVMKVYDVDPTVEVTKITVKGLPLSEYNKGLREYLEGRGVKLLKPIDYCKVINPETHQETEWFSGDRLCVAHSLKRPLPETALICGYTVRIFHPGQGLEGKKILCLNCYQIGHYRNQCRNPRACNRCQKPGHRPGDKECEASTRNPQDIVTVQGEKDPLSTFCPSGQFKIFDKVVPTMEHAYQYAKAMHKGDKDIAQKILSARHGGEAKHEARALVRDDHWQDKRAEVMKQIIEAKVDQVAEFRQALLDTQRKTIVHTIRNETFWASGLDTYDTLHTKPEFWIGDNTYGKLLMVVRESLAREGRMKTGNQSKRRRRDGHQRGHGHQSPSQESSKGGAICQAKADHNGDMDVSEELSQSMGPDDHNSSVMSLD